ncbi:alpha/beta-hydrolase [Wolfiporia cocos MD-104 SS10]|uniref:Alpha/beta-hydrolase n=1 Tax=Wolfiporia cocos (strain MD-104) TaxID=742152 RepID=A0A2H3JCI5_WOLCO|nr:alpha/beta-hydrolase [Wolfiporia cocos MD-104 SS10]
MACANCVSGFVHSGSPVGQEVTLAGLQTYVTGDEQSSRIVIFGVDIFGWKFVNTRLLADEYAARGFRVLVPDLFDGYEFPQWALTLSGAEHPTLLQRMLKPASMLVFIPFVLRNTKPAQTAKIGALLEHVRTAHPGAKVGLAGFCWGGRYAITMNARFDATVANHPSLVQFPAELADIERPISFAVPEVDKFGAELAAETERLLKERGRDDFEVVVYQGVHHGWTIRANTADAEKKAARDKARDQAIAWFEKYLVVDAE